MYSLSIFFGPSPVPAQFLFKNKEQASDWVLKAIDVTTPPHLIIADDFGQTISIRTSSIHAVILEDMDLGEESRIQRGLSQARGQANANKRAQSDPVIMAAARGQGPSILTPFGQNGFNS